jgi:FkbM family methyltransferase
MRKAIFSITGASTKPSAVTLPTILSPLARAQVNGTVTAEHYRLRKLRSRFRRRCNQVALRYLEKKEARVFKTVGDISLIQYPDAMAEGLLEGRLWRLREFDEVLSTVGNRIKGGAFIDIGSSSGMHAIYAARRSQFSKIVAIEPLSTNFAMLLANLRVNEIGNAMPIRCALSAHDGEAQIPIDPRNYGASWFGGRSEKSETVPMRRLDGLLAEFGLPTSSIGLIWMNVRGHEKEAMQGMTETMSARVPLVVIFRPETEVDPEGAIDLLRQHYRHFCSAQSGTKPISELDRMALKRKPGWIAFW